MVRALILALITLFGTVAAGALDQSDCTLPSSNETLRIGACTELIALDPTFANAYEGRGIAYYFTRDYDRAIADLTKALAFDPKAGDSYYFRGKAYGEKGELDRAI